jgi:hypothetical protein
VCDIDHELRPPVATVADPGADRTLDPGDALEERNEWLKIAFGWHAA